MSIKPITLVIALAALPLSPALAETSFPATPSGTLTPKQAEQFIRVAQRQYAQGEYKNAVGFYQRALSVEPNNVEGISGMGDAMVAAGKPLEATILYHQLMVLRPNDLHAPVGMASAYNRAGQPARGLDWINLAIAKGATGLAPVLEKGLALDLLGRPKEAQQVYGEGLKHAPNSIDLLKNMALSLALTEDYAAALQLLQKIAGEPGMTNQVSDSLATIYALSGQPDQAMKIIGSSASTVKPDEMPAKAAYYAALGRLDLVGKARAAHLGLINEDQQGALQSGPSLATLATATPQPAPLEVPLGAVSVPAASQTLSPQTQAAIKPTASQWEKPHKPGKQQMITLPDDPADATATTLLANTSAPAAGGVPAVSNPVVRASPVATGEHVWVQLGLSPSRGKLEQQWQWAFTRAQGSLSGLAPYVQPINLSGKTMLRLLVGGYADGSTATALIKRLHALKIPGFVNKNVLGADPLYP